jgi:cytoskeletal protein RodZ
VEAIGAKLSNARDAKGVTIEQAARDTHIAKRFIEAMEQEDFDQFPGEAYLLGFLRTYSSYLGLSAEDIVTLYHNIKLQEQPAPIDELLDRRPEPGKLRRLFMIGGAAAAVVVLVVLLVVGVIPIPDFGARAERNAEAETEETTDTGPISLNEQFVERRFVEGNRVSVPVDGQQALLEFLAIGDRVSVGSEAGIVQIAVGEERVLDLTGEGSGDIRLVVRQIYGDEDPPAVVARVDRVVNGQQVTEPEREGTMTSDDVADLGTGMTAEPTRERAASVVAEFPTLQEYFIEADFRGLTMFRMQVDDQDADESYLRNGDRIRTSVRDVVRLWASNAGNVRLRVAGNPVELGDQGEVIAAVIRWRQAADGTYLLELLPMY